MGTSEEQRAPGRLARLLGVFLWVAAGGFLLGAAQVWRALHSGQVWGNYRGEVLGPGELRETLVLFAVAAGLCALLALAWRRALRRRTH